MKHSHFLLRHLPLLSSALLCCGLFTSCYHSHHDLEDGGFEAPEWTEGGIPNTELQIRTRASAAAEEISYPVYVYIFKGEACEHREEIAGADDVLSLALVEGRYEVYAVGGADNTRYVLPTKDDATPTSLLSLRSGQEHGDLMVALPNTSVELEAGETRSLTLAMQRKVMLLEDIVIDRIPSRITSVDFEIATLYSGVQLDGAYVSSSPAKASFALTPAGGGTWQTTTSSYLLPASTASATLTVKLTSSEGTKSYTYTCANQLEANYKISIHGTYSETGVTLTGTITGVDWAGENKIEFIFDENGSSAAPGAGGEDRDEDDDDEGGDPDDEDPTPDAVELQVGQLYQGCYILAVQSDGMTVTLLSSRQVKNFAHKEFDVWNLADQERDIAAALQSWPQGTLGSEWRVPNSSEAQTISTRYEDINSAYTSVGEWAALATSASYVFCSGGVSYRSFKVGSSNIGAGQDLTASSANSYILLAVTDVVVTKQ